MKKKAIICDMDGTLSNDLWRRHLLLEVPKDWDKIVSQSAYDQPNKWCVDMVEMYHKMGYEIIFLTARNAKFKDLTVRWLTSNITFSTYKLLMRPELDNVTPDWAIKEIIYRNEIEASYNVELCIDDRDSVAQMWRRNGLTCLQCEDNPK